MKIRKFTATAVLAIAATGIAAGTAYAAPATPDASQTSQAEQHAVGWTVTRSGNQVIVQTAAGSLNVEDNHLVVRDGQGVAVEAVPLSLAVDGRAYPVAAQVAGNTATLTANTDPAVATAAPRLAPSDIDLPAAIGGVQPAIGLTASVGGFLGAAAGLVGGCILGATVAGVVSAPAAMLFGAGPIAGCIGGALLLGATSSLAGTAVGGLGSALANAPQFMQVLNQPAAPKK
ncbi:hypothetical protein [Rhodococcus sp. NPDC127528]|uniref:hypothetical protein n=1 Tax=unclassified Rhodococcus (in: high G+C Gram-positive bacteria) TaxID=192944 RepID=UPI00362676B1